MSYRAPGSAAQVAAPRDPQAPSHCFTIDVEEYFQVSNFDRDDQRSRWAGYESRVELGTRYLLERLGALGVRVTFFVLGWVAERHPDLVRAIAGAGHEVASHGYAHEMVTTLSPERFREDVRTGKAILEDVTGNRVLGYRAPSLTITRSTLWALPILVEEGFVYDSSVIPVVHDRYGIPGACPLTHRIDTSAGPLWEVPPSTVTVAGMRIPACGGGYLRLYPFPLFRWLLRRISASGAPIVIYVHPWEIDPDQPRLAGSRLAQFRHYRNLHKTAERIERLLQEFSFGPIREVISEIRFADSPAGWGENNEAVLSL